MRNDILRKGWTIGIIGLLVGISIAPIVTANFNPLSTNKSNGEDERESFVDVTCQVSTFWRFNQVEKEISRDRLDKISALVEDVSSAVNRNLPIHIIKEKISELAFQLDVAGLLPRSITITSATNLLMKGIIQSRRLMGVSNYDFPDGWNFLNLVLGIGQKTKVACLRGQFITSLIIPFDIIIDDIEVLNKIYKFLEFLYYRSRVLFALGGWVAKENGSVTTVGLNGIQHWNENERGWTELYLHGFAGIAVYSENSTGFILGFSLLSRSTP